MTPELADLIIRRMYGDEPRPRRRGPRIRRAKRERIYARDGHACVHVAAVRAGYHTAWAACTINERLGEWLTTAARLAAFRSARCSAAP